MLSVKLHIRHIKASQTTTRVQTNLTEKHPMY